MLPQPLISDGLRRAPLPNLASGDGTGKVRVLLVDDNPVFVRVAWNFLSRYHDLDLTGVVDGVEAALGEATRLRPNVILLDLMMSGESTLRFIPHFRQVLPEAGIIVISFEDLDGIRDGALKAGADEFVSKADAYADLLPAIRRVAGVG